MLLLTKWSSDVAKIKRVWKNIMTFLTDTERQIKVLF